MKPSDYTVEKALMLIKDLCSSISSSLVSVQSYISTWNILSCYWFHSSYYKLVVGSDTHNLLDRGSLSRLHYFLPCAFIFRLSIFIIDWITGQKIRFSDAVLSSFCLLSFLSHTISYVRVTRLPPYHPAAVVFLSTRLDLSTQSTSVSR